MEKQNINIHIYDTQIPISVPKADEEKWRKAGALVNERLNSYFSVYKARKSDKEIMYYTMIDLAMRCIDEGKRNDVQSMTEALQKLSVEISEALKKK